MHRMRVPGLFGILLGLCAAVSACGGDSSGGTANAGMGGAGDAGQAGGNSGGKGAKGGKGGETLGAGGAAGAGQTGGAGGLGGNAGIAGAAGVAQAGGWRAVPNEPQPVALGCTAREQVDLTAAGDERNDRNVRCPAGMFCDVADGRKCNFQYKTTRMSRGAVAVATVCVSVINR